MDFTDRILKCSDCGNDFIFTAGEQLFFLDRQFKNDPKRCKLCKAKRAGFGRTADGAPVAVTALPLSRTETRTRCSECGVETTVPFKPTQGRPVFCRSCFQVKRVPTAVAKAAGLEVMEAMEGMAALDPALALASGAELLSSSTMEAIAEAPVAALNPRDGALSALALAAEPGQA